MKIAFYKPQPGDVWGNLIAGYGRVFHWNAPSYCHVEIKVGDMWYSSASRNWDGTTGTRWIDEARLFKNPERWDIYELQEDRLIGDMLITCDEEKGKAYDWLGIAGFVTIFGQLNAKGKWYCSEICYYVFFGKWMKRVSPIALFVRLKPWIVRKI